ncbi:MAG TPA: serpin family protein, partial [Polyangiaceae bacterium]
MKPLGLTLSTLTLLAAIAAPSCSKTGTETDNPMGPDGIEIKRSALGYLTHVDVPAADSDALRNGTRAFALNLYAAVANQSGADENLCLGVNSISTVLTMTSAGARTTTESEFASVLQHGLAQEALHPAMNQLLLDLQAGFSNTAVRYQALNSLWLAKNRQVAAPFLDVLAQQYDTGVFLVDFLGDAAAATRSINAWASDQTQGLIPELFAAGAIDATSELVLTNAAYLSAPWRDRFDPTLTKAAEFRLPDGNVVEVPLMSRQFKYPFAIDVDWRALELPFNGTQAAMVFVLPNEGEFSDFQAKFDANQVQRIVGAIETARQDEQLVVAQVPRFEFSASVNLRSSLESLGLATAFDAAAADFTGIDPKGGLYVDGVVHRTTIGVDENGTTAAT